MDAWDDQCNGEDALKPGPKDAYVQLVISSSLGVSAFIAFCILRPRWPTLYAARKRTSDPQIALPVLPNSFLGWIPSLFRVTEEQVLASAGLDGFVFLSFFKMAIRLLSVMLFFAATVLWPINHHFVGDLPLSSPGNDTDQWAQSRYLLGSDSSRSDTWNVMSIVDGKDSLRVPLGPASVWSWFAFTWFFSLLTLYFLNTETFKIIRIRQDYLGTQSTITDRTFRLTGIPEDLRCEEKIKEFVETLEIGHVKSVTLCRYVKELDGLMAARDILLRKLEEVWSVYQAQNGKSPGASRYPESNPASGADHVHHHDEDDDDGAGENGRLLGADESLRNVIAERRPTTRVRFGFLTMRSRETDAIDYYEEKLRRLDEKIFEERKKEHTPTATAFVTMDSIAACQMAIQALVDPRPGQLLTKPAPAPSDVIWRNTYAPFWKRRLQSWIITTFITFLTILWIFPVASLAGLLSICTIEKVFPSLQDFLREHEIILALVQTSLPVLVVTLLNIAVPYLYDYLSNHQGMISQGDVELSVISKNFFFTFFNVFLVFATVGTTSKFWPVLRASFKDTTVIMTLLAESIQQLGNFYFNFIMLQGLGLFPFRLLQFGSVFLYPIFRMGAKTPRDFAELVRPPLFNYGFHLPMALLVFILCLIYSVVPGCHLVLLVGLCYFTIGYFVYKYQLLYSMDQPQHATGGAWRIISGRIIMGVVVFQIVMAAILSLRKGFTAAILITPLLLFTLVYGYYFGRRYNPLTVFIALRSIKRTTSGTTSPDLLTPESNGQIRPARQTRLTRRMSTIDEDREKGMRFINPSLVAPLEQPWIYTDPPPPLSPEESANAGSRSYISGEGIASSLEREANGLGRNASGGSSSTFSFGDTHVWRENGDSRV